MQEKQIQEAAKALESQLKELFDEVEPRIKAGEDAGKGVAELKERAEKIIQDNAAKADEIQELVQEAQDALNERIDGLETRLKAFAAEETDERIVDYQKGKRKQVDMAAALGRKLREKGITSSSEKMRVSFSIDEMMKGQKDVTTVGAVYEPYYRPGIIGPQERRITVRDLLPVIQTAQNTVYYVQETDVVDQSGPQSALGAVKGHTDIELGVESEAVRTLAHFIRVPTQLLDDIPALEGHIRARMGILLDLREEAQALYGDGTGQNLNGLFTQATEFDEDLMSTVDSPQGLDRIRKAIAQVGLSGFPATGLALNDIDWADLELVKDGDGAYIFARPQDSSVPRLWGLPVAATTAVTAGDFLAGAFNLGAELYEKQAATLSISTEDSDNFQRNLATVRAEKRVALVVLRPDAFVYGTVAPASTGGGD